MLLKARQTKLEAERALKENERYASVILAVMSVKWNKLKIALTEPIIHALTYHVANCYGWKEHFDFKKTHHGVHSVVLREVTSKLNNKGVFRLVTICLSQILRQSKLRVTLRGTHKDARKNYFIKEKIDSFYNDMMKNGRFLDVLFEYLSSLSEGEILFSSYLSHTQTEMTLGYGLPQNGLKQESLMVHWPNDISGDIFFEKGIYILAQIQKLKRAYRNIAKIPSHTEIY